MISSPVLVSRFPVGSSANTIEGEFDQRPSNGHALTLAAGEFIGLVQHAIEQTYRRKGAFGSLDALPGRSAVVEQRQLNVAQRGRPGQEIKRLEDEPHFLVADLGQIIFLESAHQAAG